MTDEYLQGITTAINLLEAARATRYRDDVRRNLVLARSALYDAITMIDLPDQSPGPP